ncbi:MAG TPA: GNAT family N-acetyltransferase [Candidatus Acidoferrum sp.]|nr:GNAT family N-acetyltransferase [Candidatus Acidoferrum sp.]
MTTGANSVQAISHSQVVTKPMVSRVVRAYSALQALPQSYSGLFDQASAKSFFNGMPWYENLSRTALGAGEKTVFLGVEPEDNANTPEILLPVRYSSLNNGPLGIRALSSLTNYYSPVFEPLLDSCAAAPDSLATLAEFLFKHSPRWHTINLKPLDRDSALFQELLRALKKAGFVVQAYFCHGNWYYPLEGRSYSEYLESLRSSVRNIARSKNKKLQRSGRARVEIVTGGEHLERGIEAYNKVYAASWKVPEPFPQFVPGLIRTCAASGSLRLGLAYVDDEPAAAQLWIVHQGVASIYKIAYDQKFKDLSVGSYLTMHLMEHAVDVDKVRELDYLSGDDRYKSDWMSHRRERWGILAMNPHTIGGAMAVVRHVGGRAGKRTLQKMMGRFVRKPGEQGKKAVPAESR